MMNGAKIHLSTQEMELVTNNEWLFLKRSILQKTEVFFGGLHSHFREIVENENIHLFSGLKSGGGKISKGENYKGLPYMILDYPARFSRDNIFAVRTLFWWGNFFSISLHLSGSYLLQNRNLKEGFLYLRDKGFLIHSGSNEWDHDLNDAGYMPVSQVNFEQFLENSKKDFFKISKKINLNEMGEVQELLEKGFREIIQFSQISSLPGGEKDL
jgi:hypothetical protein